MQFDSFLTIVVTCDLWNVIQHRYYLSNYVRFRIWTLKIRKWPDIKLGDC